MPDPTSAATASAAAPGALAGAAAAVPMLILGAHTDAIVAGLLAAVLISCWLPSIATVWRAFAAVLFSSLLAGYGSPAAAILISTYVGPLSGGADALRMPTAFLIGALTPACWPIVQRWAVRSADREANK